MTGPSIDLAAHIAPGADWRRDVVSRPVDPPPGWPAGRTGLHADALCGFFEPFLHFLYPTTIASAPAMLMQAIALMGNLISLDVWTGDEENRVLPIDWVMVCGLPGAGAKGTSLQVVRHWFEQAEPTWAETCVHQSGLTTGEGLLALFRDPSETVREDGREVSDPGALDKRGVAIQEEISTMFNKMRSSDSLTGHLLDAWYARTITNLSATNARARLRATDYRLTVIGHIQPDKWVETMSTGLTGSGFASRFLYCATHKSKDINRADPDRPRVTAAQAEYLVKEIRAIAGHAKSINGFVPFTPEASSLWASLAPQICWVPDGDLANVLLRAEEHVLRLALIYAVADRKTHIEPSHVKAACAVWCYSVTSAVAMFRLLGMTPNGNLDSTAMRLAQAALAQGAETPLSLTDLSRLLNNHASLVERNVARDTLADFGALIPVGEGRKTRWQVDPNKLKEFVNAA